MATSNGHFGGSGRMFGDFAARLASELVQQLADEHAREVVSMYQENMGLRSELGRAADLMQSYLAREQQLHAMLEQLNGTYAEHTRQLHETHEQLSARAQQTAHSHDERRKGLLEPMSETANELARIRDLLSQSPVPPPDVRTFPQDAAPHLSQSMLSAPSPSPRSMFCGTPPRSSFPTAPTRPPYQPQANGMPQVRPPFEEPRAAAQADPFDQVDRNHDGVISREEFARYQGGRPSVGGQGLTIGCTGPALIRPCATPPAGPPGMPPGRPFLAAMGPGPGGYFPSGPMLALGPGGPMPCTMAGGPQMARYV
ncbi:unnamed protein product [Polarella glacialis]|uniref:EF-hand domain-containing protein n=1 Tax=Polarella glacialis TaxID=89957 RepID=A0A813KMW9_POLGL|nr:unnamed protein product [Polarella glacialis]